MTRDEAIAALWSAKDFGDFKNPKTPPEVFLYAKLVEDTVFHEWNGIHPVDDNTVETTSPAGTVVLVTMVSRFGDVGIRARHISEKRHGYDARVLPEKLTDWSEDLPTAEPTMTALATTESNTNTGDTK